MEVDSTWSCSCSTREVCCSSISPIAEATTLPTCSSVSCAVVSRCPCTSSALPFSERPTSWTCVSASCSCGSSWPTTCSRLLTSVSRSCTAETIWLAAADILVCSSRSRPWIACASLSSSWRSCLSRLSRLWALSRAGCQSSCSSLRILSTSSSMLSARLAASSAWVTSSLQRSSACPAASCRFTRSPLACRGLAEVRADRLGHALDGVDHALDRRHELVELAEQRIQLATALLRGLVGARHLLHQAVDGLADV